MPRYVDGYVLPVPKNRIAAYRKLASIAARACMKAGALEHRECVGDQLKLPFDMKRMAFGGFKVLVSR